MLRIVRKHWKTVEAFVERDLLQARSIAIDEVEIKIRAARIRIVHIRSEDDLLSVRMKVGREIRGAVRRELAFVAAVGPHHHDLEFYRHDEVFREQLFILSNFFGRLWPARAPDDPLAVLGMPCPAVV